MNEDKLFKLLQTALDGNHTALTELRKSCQDGQATINSLHLALKDQENVCKGTDLKITDIDGNIEKILCRLNKIDSWQKVKLPIIVGVITLLITGLGFFLSLKTIAENHPATPPAHTHKIK